VRVYRGTADVWCWYRASTVGPYPAISALLALRLWAEEERAHRPVAEIVSDVLSCGESIAFAAVAWSLVVEYGRDSDQFMDAFLVHPLIWRLDIGRVVNDRSPLAPPLAEESWLRYRPDEVAMGLVVQADSPRRARLAELGGQLIEHFTELLAGDPSQASDEQRGQALMLARRWGTMLDHRQYVVKPHDEARLVVSVDMPDDVRTALEESGGKRAGQWLELSTMAFEAMKLRDGDDVEALGSDDAASLFQRVNDLIEKMESPGGDGPLDVSDAAAAAAVVLLRRGAAGLSVDEAELRFGASLLVNLAMSMDPEGRLPDAIRESVWDMGADRSIAIGLPLLLDPQMRERAGVAAGDVHDALVAIAASPFAEVRTRLVAALLPEWDGSPHGEEGHDVAMDVLDELLTTSGRGEWREAHRPRMLLSSPLAGALTYEPGNLDVANAGDALPGLDAAARGTCSHAVRAGETLDTLIEYDRRVWPAELARHRYSGLAGWRRGIDSLVAERALDGNTDDLLAHVDAFVCVAEELAGMLTELAVRATTPERAEVVHNIWPMLMDRLEPARRDRVLLDVDYQRRRPSYRDVEELDRALLLAPGVPIDWPWSRTLQLLSRWVEGHHDYPAVADRLIKVLASLGCLYTKTSTVSILAVLGTDADGIRRESRLAVAWLRGVLLEHRAAISDEGVLTRLVDELALAGSKSALVLQQLMEA
jgi:hypothetical protein